jgi:hypothetical protein
MNLPSWVRGDSRAAARLAHDTRRAAAHSTDENRVRAVLYGDRKNVKGPSVTSARTTGDSTSYGRA